MPIPWAEIGLVLVLVVVNAAFAGSEVALISLREGQLRRLEHEGGRGRLVARLAATPTSSCPPSRSASPWPGSWPRRRPRSLWPSRWSRCWGSWAGRPSRWPWSCDRGPYLPDPGRRGAGAQADRLAAARAVGETRRPSPNLDHHPDPAGGVVVVQVHRPAGP